MTPIPHLSPIKETVRSIDEHYFALHRKCAEGTATEQELDELDEMIAKLERENA